MLAPYSPAVHAAPDVVVETAPPAAAPAPAIADAVAPGCAVCGPGVQPGHCQVLHDAIVAAAVRLIAPSGMFPERIPAHVLTTARIALGSLPHQAAGCCPDR